MNKILKKQTRKYFRKIQKMLTGTNACKHAFLSSLQINVENYITEYSITDFKEIEQQFGTATEIAEAFLSEQSNLDIIKKLHRLKMFRILATLIILSMLIFFINYLYHLRNGYPAKVETHVQMESYIPPEK